MKGRRDEMEDVIGLMDPNRYALKETLAQLFKFLELEIPYRGTVHRVTTRRLKSRPYDTLRAAPAGYRAVLNRGAHWNPHHNGYLTIISTDAYLLNDMISFRGISKNTSFAQMARLGLHVPPTVAIPQHDYTELKLDPTTHEALMFEDFELFDLEECGDAVGYPAFLKPQEGGGWVGVQRVTNARELEAAYARSGDRPMNLQKEVPYREFVRAVGVGPLVIPMHYNPEAPRSHERYLRDATRAVDQHFLSEDARREVSRLTRIVDAFYNWDHNSCEILIDPQGKMFLIDFANACPDSSPVSLHFYFPELVKALAKWLVFVSVTGRKKPYLAHNWDAFFEIRDRADQEGWTYEQRLEAYDALAMRHFDADTFDAFCHTHLADFDFQAYDFFGSDTFAAILEREVDYFFKAPEEKKRMLAHYMGLHDFWLHCERGRLRQARAR